MLAVFTLLTRPLAADETLGSPETANSADAFFAGTVVEASADKITVARSVLGKAEDRTFLLTPETKIEGSLAAKIRVTVRYRSDPSGDDIATMVLVRPAAPASPQSKQKK